MNLIFCREFLEKSNTPLFRIFFQWTLKFTIYHKRATAKKEKKNSMKNKEKQTTKGKKKTTLYKYLHIKADFCDDLSLQSTECLMFKY